MIRSILGGGVRAGRTLTLLVATLAPAVCAAPAAAQSTVYVRSDGFSDPDGLLSARDAVEFGVADTIVLETSVRDARPLRFTRPVQIIGNGHHIRMDAVDGTLLRFDMPSVSDQVSLRDLVLEGFCGSSDSCETSQQGIAAGDETALGLEGVRVTGFTGAVLGAGLYCAGWCELLECDFDHNHSVYDAEVPGAGVGGAIFVGPRFRPHGHRSPDPSGFLLVERSHLYENSAFAGGAVYVYGAEADIERSAFDANRATWGGAIMLQPIHRVASPDPEPGPSGVGSLRVGNSTLHANVATDRGGHIHVHNPALLVVESSTLTAGHAPQGQSIFAAQAWVYLANSIIDGDANACVMPSSLVTSCRLLTDPRAACSTQSPPDPSLACADRQAASFDLEPYAPISLVVPRYGPLGPMPGRRPRIGSPVFGAAEPSLPAPWRSYGVDQAGHSRTGGWGPDIGALEL